MHTIHGNFRDLAVSADTHHITTGMRTCVMNPRRIDYKSYTACQDEKPEIPERYLLHAPHDKSGIPDSQIARARWSNCAPGWSNCAPGWSNCALGWSNYASGGSNLACWGVKPRAPQVNLTPSAPNHFFSRIPTGSTKKHTSTCKRS